ncbi:SMI1/KNR4 family protein [Kitasatospora sp. NPDC048407]|uniref:SMI1/KNR4 family protein n=1 Tax=Kitasatospora sp. NPDC048407 TaxID=3364051 RepID=UPI003724AD8A
MDWTEVRHRTVALFAQRGTGINGRSGLPDVLTEAQVRQAEEQFGVTFPDDYRQYLLHVSAGGKVRTLRFDGSRWDWDGAAPWENGKLHVPFPDHDTALAASDYLCDREPNREDFASEAAYQADYDAWDEAVGAAEDARTTGAVFLLEHGCGFSTLLVVTGPMRGRMWWDGRAACDRLSPLLNDDHEAATFEEWYLDWLAHEESRTTSDSSRDPARTPICDRWVGRKSPIQRA